MLEINKDLKEKSKLLSIVAYGAHKKLNDNIKLLMDDLKIKTYYFYEFFLSQPIIKKNCLDENGEFSIDQLEDIPVITPFLTRIISERDFIPLVNINTVKKSKNYFKIAYLPKEESIIDKYWYENFIPLGIKNSVVLKYLVQGWVQEIKEAKRELNNEHIRNYKKNTYHIETSIDKEFLHFFATLDPSYYRNHLKKHYIKILDDNDNSVDAQEAVVGMLKEFIVSIKPWMNVDPAIKGTSSFLATSINSRNIFWGEALIFVPELKGKEKNRILSKIKKEICFWISDTYLPILTLFENYWCESFLEKIEKKVDGLTNFWELVKSDSTYLDKAKELLNKNVIFLSACKTLEKSNYIIEHKLAELWKERRDKLKDKTNSVRESLLFQKYLIASPGMINNIVKVMSLGLRKPTVGEPLSSVLVIGGPGSGKDKLARLVKIFSQDYRFSDEVVLNMAAIKPKELTIPILLGMNLKFKKEGDAIITESILAQKTNRNNDTIDNDIKTFIFDELNSLDIDSQGAILRILENGEIRKLGDLKKQNICPLIIGVMNEKPSVIHKKFFLDTILKDKEMFGGLLGDIMYEYLHNLRRLREDLYFRFIRSGEIIIPELSERREDIPILFYFILTKEELEPSLSREIELERDNISDNNPTLFNGIEKEKVKIIVDLRIDMSAFDLLMDESLMWQGNIRELQTLAKRTFEKAKTEFIENSYSFIKSDEIEKNMEKIDDEIKLKGVFYIRFRHVKQVLDDHKKQLKIV